MSETNLLKTFRLSIPEWRSDSTKYRYIMCARQFINAIGVKDAYTKQDAMRYIGALSKKKSRSYARWCAHVLNSFYESQGWEKPINRNEMPPPPTSFEIRAPVIPKLAIKRYIINVNRNGTPAMKAYLALSTTYGMRRQEMADLSEKSFSLNKFKVHVMTLKGGEPRIHIVPEEIRAILLDYEFEHQNPQNIINLFHRIQKCAGVEHQYKEGFHSIRRSLVTELMNAGVPIHIVYSFLRWKMNVGLGMVGVYAKPEHEDADKAVFKKHPFLQYYQI